MMVKAELNGWLISSGDEKETKKIIDILIA